ncbi:MAG: DEAD/DEAH box helicase [Saprospiraceae bacterium]|nr:DEAD/DEAH box helicase [Saprospiraceae bacterium]MDZ4705835.1 DEAD/DEAH box helicase [Saprospiraceae bacterium]
MSFTSLGLIEPLLKALHTEGYTTPTPIQTKGIPLVLSGRDLLACAQTGTGKTAAFSLPILQLLHESKEPVQPGQIRALILTPTRELAIQIDESMKAYGRNLPLRSLVIFGGVPDRPQIESLRRRTDILVATPGRLLDLMQQGHVNLNHIKFFVLDEADRMLDMGFIHDVRRVIAKLPTRRHTLFFSATMPPEIVKLSDSILTNPAQIEISPVSSTAEKVEQSIFYVDKNDKKHLLAHLLKNPEITSALVFTRTKHGADRVVRDLSKMGTRAEAIHGNKSQNARQNALNNFKSGRIRVLVATDIAARGIDVDNLSHVINFELPNIPETYVHRIGRTGRAGASGIALSFCDQEEKAFLKDIQKLIRQNVPVVNEHPYPLSGLGVAAFDQPEPSRQPQRRETSTAAYGGGSRRKSNNWRGNR